MEPLEGLEAQQVSERRVGSARSQTPTNSTVSDFQTAGG